MKERHGVRDSIVHLLYISGPAIIQLKLEHKQGKKKKYRKVLIRGLYDEILQWF